MMPKLNYPKITKGDAISALIRLYRKHPQFMKELKNIREPYMNAILKLAVNGMVYFQENNVSPTDYYQATISYMKGESKLDPLPVEQAKDAAQLQPYFDDLDRLAEKWKIKAPWAILMFFIFDMIDALSLESMPDELEIPMEKIGSLIPWSPPLPPLKMEVSAWMLILFGRDKIMSEIADKLKEYEGKLKGTDIKEYPSSLENHSRWWFEHYINGKKYDEIAQMETETPGGSLISYAKNVGIAVRKFSKFIGVNLKG
jgi:hypothetical protein